MEEVEFKTIREGSSCPGSIDNRDIWNGSTDKSHKFIHHTDLKIYFCQRCGLTIKYGEPGEKAKDTINENFKRSFANN